MYYMLLIIIAAVDVIVPVTVIVSVMIVCSDIEMFTIFQTHENLLW